MALPSVEAELDALLDVEDLVAAPAAAPREWQQSSSSSAAAAAAAASAAAMPPPPAPLFHRPRMPFNTYHLVCGMGEFGDVGSRHEVDLDTLFRACEQLLGRLLAGDAGFTSARSPPEALLLERQALQTLLMVGVPLLHKRSMFWFAQATADVVASKLTATQLCGLCERLGLPARRVTAGDLPESLFDATHRDQPYFFDARAFAVPFEHALDMVKARTCVLHKGEALVPPETFAKLARDLLVSFFYNTANNPATIRRAKASLAAASEVSHGVGLCLRRAVAQAIRAGKIKRPYVQRAQAPASTRLNRATAQILQHKVCNINYMATSVRAALGQGKHPRDALAHGGGPPCMAQIAHRLKNAPRNAPRVPYHLRFAFAGYILNTAGDEADLLHTAILGEAGLNPTQVTSRTRELKDWTKTHERIRVGCARITSNGGCPFRGKTDECLAAVEQRVGRLPHLAAHRLHPIDLAESVALALSGQPERRVQPRTHD